MAPAPSHRRSASASCSASRWGNWTFSTTSAPSGVRAGAVNDTCGPGYGGPSASDHRRAASATIRSRWARHSARVTSADGAPPRRHRARPLRIPRPGRARAGRFRRRRPTASTGHPGARPAPQLVLPRPAGDALQPALARLATGEARHQHVDRSVDPDHQIRAGSRVGSGPLEHPDVVGTQRRRPPLLHGSLVEHVDPGVAARSADRVAHDEQVGRARDAIAGIGLIAAHSEVDGEPKVLASSQASHEDGGLAADARRAWRVRADRRHDVGGRHALQPERRDERTCDRRLSCTGQATELDDGSHVATGGTRSHGGSR